MKFNRIRSPKFGFKSLDQKVRIQKIRPKKFAKKRIEKFKSK